MTSPSVRRTRRSTPWVLGCCGPMLTSISSVRTSNSTTVGSLRCRSAVAMSSPDQSRAAGLRTARAQRVDDFFRLELADGGLRRRPGFAQHAADDRQGQAHVRDLQLDVTALDHHAAVHLAEGAAAAQPLRGDPLRLQGVEEGILEALTAVNRLDRGRDV